MSGLGAPVAVTALVRSVEQRPIHARTIAAFAFAAFGLASLAVSWAGDDRLPIVLPALTILFTAGGAVAILAVRDGALPVFELGPFYLAVVSLYALFPLLGNLALGGEYTEVSDIRLFGYAPKPADLAPLAWYYALYVASFATAYVATRGRARLERLALPRPGRSIVAALLIILVASRLFDLFLRFVYDVRPTSYTESYLIIQRLPLALRQIAGVVTGVNLATKGALLLALFIDYRRTRAWIFAWLAFEVVWTFAEHGVRTELMLLLLSAVVMYHYVVRPLRLWAVLACGFGGMGMYLVIGALRVFSGDRLFVNPFGFTDFDGIFANAFDLMRRRAVGQVSIPRLGLYLTDVTALIPQPLLPFEKFAPSEWYMREFWHAMWEAGAGMAFGTIAEAIVGLGWIDVLWRGAAVGIALAWFHRRVSGKPGYWLFLLYVWTLAWSYQNFRNTTFYESYIIAYRFVPAVILIQVVAALLRGRRRAALPA